MLSSSPLSAGLPAVSAELSYLADEEQTPQVRVYPVTSGLQTVRPVFAKHALPVHDVRPRARELKLDQHGFELHLCPTKCKAFFDETAVKRDYFAEVRRAMLSFTGAREVIPFDYTVRSAARAAQGLLNVRVPVEQIHVDYTNASGPKRKLDILKDAGRLDLVAKRVAFVNLWRPISSPVQDNPLAVCNAETVAMDELIATSIRHYSDSDFESPRHTGEIYSVHYRPAHEWFYVSDMRSDEALLLKCYDSLDDGRARFMPHTGFTNPACPPEFTPRESIEVRTLVIFDEDL